MPTLLNPEPQAQEPVAKTVAKLWQKLGVVSKEIIEANSLQIQLTFDSMGRLTQRTAQVTIDMGRTIGEGYRKGGGCSEETTRSATVVRGPNGIITAYPDLGP
jgi:hypothetical protein